MVLDQSDFKALADTAIQRFAEGVAAADPAICWEFDMEVARLESQVIQLYGISVLLAKREPDLDGVAEVWRGMILVCDTVSQKIRELCRKHPACAASLDRILDIRNKAARLRDLHS